MKGHIRRRGKKWAVVLPAGRDPESLKYRYRWFSGFDTRKAAELALPDLLAQASSGGLIPRAPSSMTLGEFLARWLEDYAQTNVRARTLQGYRTIVEGQLIPHLGSLKLSALQPYHVQAYYGKALKGGRRNGTQGLSARTVNHHHRLLSEALGHAVKWGLVQRNVAKQVDPPRVQRREMLALTGEQVATLLRAARETPHYALIHLAAYTGLRRSELLGLRWKDIDFERGTLTVAQTLLHVRDVGFVFEEPKSRSSRRTVALAPTSIEELRIHQQDKGSVSLAGLVFSREDGTPMEPDAVSLAVIRLARATGLPKGTGIHTMRHTHASLMLAANTNLKVVSERLGHSTVGVTADIYAHVLPHIQREAATAFEQAIPKP